MFISKSEKESLVETSLNLGEKIMGMGYELTNLKALMKKSPSWKWVEGLEKSFITLEKQAHGHFQNQSTLSKKVNNRIDAIEEQIAGINEKISILLLSINGIEQKSTQEPVIAKKRGRPVGSKAKRPKFPPKTPFELKKPLGRPKGSKNKAK